MTRGWRGASSCRHIARAGRRSWLSFSLVVSPRRKRAIRQPIGKKGSEPQLIADDNRRRRASERRRPPAARNLRGEAPPEEDVLVCGDDAASKAIVLELAERITSGRAIDCGPLPSARALEGLTAVIVNVNKRYKAHAGIRLSGVP